MRALCFGVLVFVTCIFFLFYLLFKSNFFSGYAENSLVAIYMRKSRLCRAAPYCFLDFLTWFCEWQMCNVDFCNTSVFSNSLLCFLSIFFQDVHNFKEVVSNKINPHSCTAGSLQNENTLCVLYDNVEICLVFLFLLI